MENRVRVHSWVELFAFNELVCKHWQLGSSGHAESRTIGGS